MKRTLITLTLVIAAVLLLTGCQKKTDAESSSTYAQPDAAPQALKADNASSVDKASNKASDADKAAAPKTLVHLAGLKGPTTMGMVKLLDDAENGLTANDYEFTLAGSADEISPKFLKGELDIIAAPVNLGAVLNKNSGGAVEMMAVNTLGVVYIVEKNGQTIQSLKDLAGKTVYATGRGSTPEYALTYLLAQNGLDINKDVDVQWKSEPTEIVALMNTAENAVAMMPQPYVTVAGNQFSTLRIAVDLTAEWDALGNGSQFLTAGIFVRKAFAEEHPEAVKAFLADYSASTSFVTENVADAAQLVEKYGIVKAPIAQKAIPYCNIVCITGSSMKTMTQGYLKVLFDLNPKAVGGELPGDAFYLTDE